MTRLDSLTDKSWQAHMLALASLSAWLIHDPHQSRRSQPGFPDLTLSSAPRPLLLLEIKTRRGRTKPEQPIWLDQLGKGPGVDVGRWRPANWPTVVDASWRRRR